MPLPPAIELVRGLFAAFARGDPDGILSRLTDDVSWSPGAFVTGRNHYAGREGVRTALREVDDIARAERLIRATPRQFLVDRADETKVLVLAHLVIVRSTGDELESEPAYLFTLAGDKVCALDTWTSHAEGLLQLKEPAEVPARPEP